MTPPVPGVNDRPGLGAPLAREPPESGDRPGPPTRTTKQLFVGSLFVMLSKLQFKVIYVVKKKQFPPPHSELFQLILHLPPYLQQQICSLSFPISGVLC